MATYFASVPDLLRVLDLTGVFANALLGGAVARRHGFDPVGFAALAIVSGLGGGLIRDTLLQHGTPVALTNYAYLTTALIGAAVAYAVSGDASTSADQRMHEVRSPELSHTHDK